jgi:O-antigen/teichoic acid export membrane protein
MNELNTNIYKRNAIWNAIAGIVNALEAVVVLAVVSRINGLRLAGIVTIAFSFGNLFMTVGKFGMRNFQVAHGGYDVSFKTFLHSRLITTAGMVVTICCYLMLELFLGKYSAEKIQIIFWICMWYVLESLEDVFVGQSQVKGRLDVGSKMFSFRWISMILVFIFADIICKKIILSAIIGFGVGLIVEIIQLYCTKSLYVEQGGSLYKKSLSELFLLNVPLFVSSFLYFYINNLSKYIINSELTDEIQAIYGYISMPVFLIALLNSFIYQPQLTQYVAEVRNGNIAAIRNRIIKQLMVILLILVICMIGAWIVGIPLLSVLYHQNLYEYKKQFMILLVGGGFNAVAGYSSSMLTIMDRQRMVMYGYVITSVFGSLVITQLVRNYEMWGAVYGYVLLMFIEVILFVTFLTAALRKKNVCVNKKL